MPISVASEPLTNRDMMVEIIHLMNSLKTEIARLKSDISHLKRKCDEADERNKSGWIW